MLTGPHRRYNPLLDEWVLCSPHRLERPWQGQTEAVPEEGLPEYDPSCYLCPGNLRANGARNPTYASTFVFDNDFPALLDAPEAAVPEDEIFRTEPARGFCRVVCFSPRHDLSLARMGTEAVRGVVDAWADEVERLGSIEGVRWVQVFENKGAIMGCSNPHPHCQAWATRYVPTLPARKVAAQSRYFEQHGRDLLGDYLDGERRAAERLVCSNEHWTALVPYWAVWPFEILLLPSRRVRGLSELDGAERDALASILRGLNARYDNLFRTSFPYSMGWHGAPLDGQAHPGCRLHGVYFPPLLRSSTIRKFLVGFELTAEPQRDLTPEAAAARLGEQPERHYTEEP
jgi:UDPglucose--hexose-1-phosphate uridylyltransferase